MAKSGLTSKKNIFIQEYLIDKNATRAAKAAGYSAKTAYSQGQRLLKNVEIAKAIESSLEEQAKEANLSAERILQEIASIAFGDLTIAINCKLRALELLGKHFRLFTDKVEIADKNNGPKVILYLPENGSESTPEPKEDSEDCESITRSYLPLNCREATVRT